MKTSVLTTTVGEKKLAEINYKCSENQVDDEDLVIGMMTKQFARRLFNEGDITTHQLKVFYKAVRAFFVRAVEYLLKWCPITE